MRDKMYHLGSEVWKRLSVRVRVWDKVSELEKYILRQKREKKN